jgi:hypothetical protein
MGSIQVIPPRTDKETFSHRANIKEIMIAIHLGEVSSIAGVDLFGGPVR